MCPGKWLINKTCPGIWLVFRSYPQAPRLSQKQPEPLKNEKMEIHRGCEMRIGTYSKIKRPSLESVAGRESFADKLYTIEKTI